MLPVTDFRCQSPRTLDYNDYSTVLDGEPAVPCNPQPAKVGSNSLSRPESARTVTLEAALKAGALREELPVKSVRTGR